MESKLEQMVSGSNVEGVSGGPKDPNKLAGSTGEYEFDAAENEVISGLSGAMKFVAVIFMVLGIINALGGVLGGANLPAMVTLGQGILMIVVGGWLIGAAGSFKDVVTTEGNDISHMMAALRKLRSVYTLQAWVLGIVCALAVVLIVFVLMRVGHG